MEAEQKKDEGLSHLQASLYLWFEREPRLTLDYVKRVFVGFEFLDSSS